ncbi:hypothetical protein ILUMI_17086 [Ignelater luminosus]|uniref:Uncharacterized protein n=1 Tax=Ignelater luminosus TaxID=2038154 RepID=A0A8K0CRN6_IGNLU|nr:hypothetical protein ILUMI_17086 [Ignelater luminosus]
METRGYQLFVEKYSSSYGLLENGTGLYGDLWNMMTKKQPTFVIDSVEEGVQLVRQSTNVAVVAGRETLFFDIQRFGAENFHLSEKLNTAYSAIAFQIGCPYIENFNRILMAIFEAGILTKMTEDEYEKLGKQQTVVNSDTKNTVVPTGKKETRKAAKATEDNQKSRPISIKMLQGAFYLLFIGHVLSGIALLFEVGIVQQKRNLRSLKRNVLMKIRKIKRRIWLCYSRIVGYFRRRIREMLHDAFLETLEYLE